VICRCAIGVERGKHDRDICMVRSLFSIVSRILSEKLKVKEAVESSAVGSKLERNE
jgi:hypothetical protein